MSEDIRIWKVMNEDNLSELSKAKLDFEVRLETWIENDISLISDDLLVIGRQISIDYGGTIDLLCLDYNGDIVVVELKRDKTPREVVAQTLDYASWVKDLSNEKITELANNHLKENGPLEDAFQKKFQTMLPETLNEHHKMLIIASDIDSRSERIIKYLSESYGVPINALKFQYFQNGQTEEFLARVFLIDPVQVDYYTTVKTSSKRKSYISPLELEEMAESNGVGELYKSLLEGLKNFFNPKTTPPDVRSFVIKTDSGQRNFMNLFPNRSTENDGLKFQFYIKRFMTYFGKNKEQIEMILPQNKSEIFQKNINEDIYEGFFKNINEVNDFLSGLAGLNKEKLDQLS